MARIKSLAANVGLMLVSILVLVLLGELALQVLLPVLYRPKVTRIDPILGWTHNPSVSTSGEVEGHPVTVSYNSHGYRVPEHSLEPTENQARVVILGDSFVDGAEVDDTEVHTVLMQEEMTDVEVINLGVYAYSTAQELVTLERIAVQYSPDLIVLLTITNDFAGNTRNFYYFGPAPRFLLSGDSLIYEPISSTAAEDTFRRTNLPVPIGMSFLHRHSDVYYVVNHYIYQRLIGERVSEILRAQVQAVSSSDQREMYRRMVLRMKEQAQAMGAKFLLVFGYQHHEIVGNSTSPYETLADSMRAEGVEVLDLFGELKQAEESGERSLWYDRDIHWNRRGHRVVADVLMTRVDSILGNGGFPSAAH